MDALLLVFEDAMKVVQEPRHTGSHQPSGKVALAQSLREGARHCCPLDYTCEFQVGLAASLTGG